MICGSSVVVCHSSSFILRVSIVNQTISRAARHAVIPLQSRLIQIYGTFSEFTFYGYRMKGKFVQNQLRSTPELDTKVNRMTF